MQGIPVEKKFSIYKKAANANNLDFVHISPEG